MGSERVERDMTSAPVVVSAPQSAPVRSGATVVAPHVSAVAAMSQAISTQPPRVQRSASASASTSVPIIRRALGDAHGITGGKTTLADFQGSRAGSKIDSTKAALAESVNAGSSLADMRERVATGKARTADEMLSAIAADTLPRYLARVGPKENFTRFSCFGRPNEFIFATEPADLAGMHPVAAMYKVGWEKASIVGQADKPIAICIFDTHRAIPDKADPSKSVKVSLGKMEWPELKAKALADAIFLRNCAAGGIVDAGACFDIWQKTPVRGDPKTDDATLKADCHKIRIYLNDLYGANPLYSGMGATIREDGAVGAREIMVSNNGTGFALTPDNHVLVDTTPPMFTKQEAEAL